MEMGSEAVRLTSMDIDTALENDHFQVVFQPVFRLSDGALMRVESFVRWTHPGLGVLPPGAFISFFESQGRMGELTRHVVETALKQYLAWRGPKGPGLSVNLAQSDVCETDFAAWLAPTLVAHGFPAHLLTLECPALPADISIEDAAAHFARLRRTGARLAIEVRGRANELVRRIDPFPFDEVKTGGSAILRFARTMRGGPGLTAISELLELANARGAEIIAVGVEDETSLTALAELGFSAAQGNYLATIGDLDGLDVKAVNKVREALGHSPISARRFEALLTPKSAEEAKSDAPAPRKAKATKPKATKTKKRQLSDLTPEQRSRLKSQLAARKKAQGTAQDAPAEEPETSTLSDDSDVAQRRSAEEKELQESLARRKADENARRLQSRLAEAYQGSGNGTDDPAGIAEDVNAGLLLGQPLPEPDDTPASQQDETEPSSDAAVSDRQDEASQPDMSPARDEQQEEEKNTMARASRKKQKSAPEPDTAEEPVSEDDTDAVTSEETSADRDAASDDEPDEEIRAEDAEATAKHEETPEDRSFEDLAAQSADEGEHEYSAIVSPEANDAHEESAEDDEPLAARAELDDLIEVPSSLPRLGYGRTFGTSLKLSGIAQARAEETPATQASETDIAQTAEDEVEKIDPVQELDDKPWVEAAAPDEEPEAGPVETLNVSDEEPETLPDQLSATFDPAEIEPLISPVIFAEHDVILPEASADDFRTEEDELDEALAETEELDPTLVHEDVSEQADEHHEIDSTERLIAGRLRTPRQQRRKSWLQRRHRIMPTHFWPKAWKRKWHAMRSS